MTRTPTGQWTVMEMAARCPPPSLFVSDLPMYMPEAGVEEALLRLNVVIKSKIMHDLARDEKGKLSRLTTGRHFVYIVLPEEPLPKSFDFGIFKQKLYYKEQPKSSSSKMY